ncbi:MAG: beta-lactamase family protein [Candidatus Eremiobacteraeota bacterium]|nr:beta-lactamase family protein [Candidatus Eremiobacteraeota bacterium]
MLASKFSPIDDLLHKATGTWFTAAVARIEHRGKLVFEEAYGTTRDDESARSVYVDTSFDLASITKLFVSTLALAFVDEGRLTLDGPLLDWAPEWRATDHAAITLRMLLAHTSGMNSGADYRTLLDANAQNFALTRALAAAPGEKVIYSDLGLIALGALLERVAGMSLSALLAQRFSASSARFVPRERGRIAIPATEMDAWRGRVQGFVHDEKAYLMNGVAGHAGLFGTAADVAALAEVYLAALGGREQALLSPALAREAVHEAAYDPVLRRGLGWALKTNDDNSCGRLMSHETFGHTGFTGTCVWSDPQRDVTGVLLTNSVYFGRSDSRPLRAAFFEALIEAIN